MWEPEIRIARSEDCATVEALRTAARRGLEHQRGGARWCAENPLDDTTDAINRQQVLVACLDDVPLGYMQVEVIDESGATSALRVTVIREVYVDPDARSIGCGDGLMEAALDWARARGCQLLEGSALPGDRETKNLFERAGITARLITVSVQL